MSGETEDKPSSWTIDSLHQHLILLLSEYDKRYEQRFVAQSTAIDAAITAQRSAIDAALIAAQRATDKAEQQADHRFEGVNEFRQTLSDQAALFVTRTEVEATTLRATERLAEVSVRIQGMASQTEVISAYKGTTDRLDHLAERLTRVESTGLGRAAQRSEHRSESAEDRASFSSSYGMWIAAITVVIAIVSVTITLLTR